MYAKITGTTIKILDAAVIVDTGAVAYELQLTDKDLTNVELDQTISLWTFLDVNETALRLFGFANFDEREMFKLLISISGIGPKLALKILSHANPDEIQNAVGETNPALFKSISGIGSKNAQRIILELQTKLGQYADNVLKQSQTKSKDLETVYAALKNLGYDRDEVRNVLGQLDPDHTVEEKIKAVLKRLG